MGKMSWIKHSSYFIQIFVSLHDISKHAVNVVLWLHFKKHSSLNNALLQRCEAGKGWKTKAVKYENLSETCHEISGNSESELLGCEFLVPKEGGGLI